MNKLKITTEFTFDEMQAFVDIAVKGRMSMDAILHEVVKDLIKAEKGSEDPRVDSLQEWFARLTMNS